MINDEIDIAARDFAKRIATPAQVVSRPASPQIVSDAGAVLDGRNISRPATSAAAQAPEFAGTPETVTGAVNGVPSTLNVLTDGSGWTEI